MADYSLPTGICELVDNALDQWGKTGKNNPLTVSVDIELDQQSIRIEDNGGGVALEDLAVLVRPGGTTGSGSEEQIGIFGVGSKRSVVFLGQHIQIITRVPKGKTHLVEYDDAWLADQNWHLTYYEVQDIPAGTTVVEVSKLRTKIEQSDLEALREHLSATYALILQDGRFKLRLNDGDVEPLLFDNWAFPPDYSPRRFSGPIFAEQDRIQLNAIAGLVNEEGSIAGEYGVYFYCNDRLISRALKTPDVGFVRGLAGAPHNVVSIVRVLVFLRGPAHWMPWNSSKSGINVSHRVFKAIQAFVMHSVENFADVSKRFHGDWPDKVFRHKTGKFVDETIDDFATIRRSFLPKLPAKRLNYSGTLHGINQTLVEKKPWTKGPIETDIAVDLLQKQKLEQKNRLSLILLDSSLEIAYKDYLVHESGKYYKDAELLELFASRHRVEQAIQSHVSFNRSLQKQLKYYHSLRNKLIHERVTAEISDREIEIFRKCVHRVQAKLFGIRWKSRHQVDE